MPTSVWNQPGDLRQDPHLQKNSTLTSGDAHLSASSLGSARGADYPTTLKDIAESPGQLLILHVDQLRLHSWFLRHKLLPTTRELASLAKLGDVAFQSLLTITEDGSILDGCALWQLARMQGRTKMHCLVRQMTEEEALLWIIQKNRRIKGINDFNRVLLALELEPWFNAKARSNQQAGGQWKGSSRLTKAARLDVRREIAKAAGVSAGNVSKIKYLTRTAHVHVLEALRLGEVSIHRAWGWSKEGPGQEQLALIQFRAEKGIKRDVENLVSRHREKGLESLRRGLEVLSSDPRLGNLRDEIVQFSEKVQQQLESGRRTPQW